MLPLPSTVVTATRRSSPGDTASSMMSHTVAPAGPAAAQAVCRGERRRRLIASTGASAARSTSATSALAAAHAKWSGVLPSTSCPSTATRFSSTRNVAISLWPPRMLTCRGARLQLSRAVGTEPRSISSAAVEKWPLRHAWCSAVVFCVRGMMFAPRSRRNSTAARRPRMAAALRADTPSASTASTLACCSRQRLSPRMSFDAAAAWTGSWEASRRREDWWDMGRGGSARWERQGGVGIDVRCSEAER